MNYRLLDGTALLDAEFSIHVQAPGTVEVILESRGGSTGGSLNRRNQDFLRFARGARTLKRSESARDARLASWDAGEGSSCLEVGCLRSALAGNSSFVLRQARRKEALAGRLFPEEIGVVV